MWQPADFGGRDAATIRLCVDGACEERTAGSPGDPFAPLAVRLPDDIGATTVPVRLTVTVVKGGDKVVGMGPQTKLNPESDRTEP
ncbi:hypothetical protein ABT147_29150 [Streptomyces sp. NPDC001868]|uniref:hypothetical protein n=1 Tax=Streptomyces sp. NPDC001868 TaxID=3154401 RepID=UPI00332FE999